VNTHALKCGFVRRRRALVMLKDEGAVCRHYMTKPRILVVDDEPNISGLVRYFLEKTQRFEVRVENRSSIALAAAREFRPDMILLDVDMPGKDGGEVSREIEAEPSLRGVPILFFTSLISRAEAGEHETVRAGKRFLSKPVNPKVLIEVVDRILAGEVHAA
jgi:two-component system OmpR family response regulator